jgi:hypothetical protein
VGTPAKGKPCKGMEGLIAEGEEVMEEGEELEDAAADLALIAAAQKVEHYEISAYGTARTMVGQIGLPAVAELLNKSLAEEENRRQPDDAVGARANVRVAHRTDQAAEADSCGDDNGEGRIAIVDRARFSSEPDRRRCTADRARRSAERPSVSVLSIGAVLQ